MKRLFWKALVRSESALLKLLSPLRGPDLSAILDNDLERVLDRPRELQIFPTAVTPVAKVQSLFARLHPVLSGKDLIRIGPEGDGGYLIPDDLEGVTACFSPGVSITSGFEEQCAERGLKVFMADASVDGPPVANPAFSFIKKFIGGTTRDEFITLDDWVLQSLPESESDLLLQMDIEGFEFEVLNSISTSLLKRFRIIVIEFHYLERLFCEPLFPLYALAFERLLETHDCVHNHPNNFSPPMTVDGLRFLPMAELTFLRKDRVQHQGYAKVFPHPLDRDNTNKPTTVLPEIHYQNSWK